MGLGKVFKALGFWTNAFVWNEPLLYRVRLRGDLLLRVCLSIGIGLIGMSGLLAAFAINRNPPHPLAAGFGFLLGAGLALLFTCNGRSNSSGKVRICEEGIHRKRFYVGVSSNWMEELSWPYEAIGQCVIVPAQALGKSFSVLIVVDQADFELFGIPAKIDLNQLSSFLSSRGVRVVASSQLPAQYTRRMNLPLAALTAAAGLMLLVASSVFYATSVVGRGQPPRGPIAHQAVDVHRGGPRFDRRAAIPEQPAAIPAFPQPRDSAPPPPPPPPPPPSKATESIRAASDGGSSSPDLASSATDPFIPTRPQRPAEVSSLPRSNAEPVSDPAISTSPQPAIHPSPQRDQVLAGRRKTDVLGGKGGFEFQLDDPNGRPMVGVRYTTASWAGQQAIGQLQPLFDRDAKPSPSQVAMAREGYVVGGLQVEATNFVTAIRVVFVRENEGGVLDLEDFYMSPWLGNPSGNRPKTLGNGKDHVLGIYGRRGAVLDAVGLILEQR